MSKAGWLTAAVGVVSAMLLTTVRGAGTPEYLYWSAAQMADLDKQMLTTMSPTKGARVNMMPTIHSFLLVADRQSNPPAAEMHQKYGEFAVVRSGRGGILIGGKLVGVEQSGPNELRGQIEGGTHHRLTPGDAYYVPANVPHQRTVEAGSHSNVEMLKVEIKDGFTDIPKFMVWEAALLLSTEKKLKAKINKSSTAVEDFIKNDNMQFYLSHNEGTSDSELNPHSVEFQIIRNGEGTIMLGGKVVNAKIVGSGETRGTALEGATRRPLGAGDLLYIPPGMPHQTIVDRNKSQDKFVIKVWVP